MPTPAFLPLSVTLMGRHNLGTVRARWLDGGRLELDDGAIYGPGAVFSARPVVEAQEPEPLGAPASPWRITYEVPSKLSIGDLGWGNDCEHQPAPTPAPVVEPEPVPPVERLRYEGQAVRWAELQRNWVHLCAGQNKATGHALAWAKENGEWCAYKGTSFYVLKHSTAPNLYAAKTAALRALLTAGVLTVEPEPVDPRGEWRPRLPHSTEPPMLDGYVDVRRRDGTEQFDHHVQGFDWRLRGEPKDIVAWRPATVAKVEPADDRIRSIADVKPGDWHSISGSAPYEVLLAHRTETCSWVVYKYRAPVAVLNWDEFRKVAPPEEIPF